MKAEYSVGDTAYLSNNYVTNEKIRLKCDDAVIISAIHRADMKHAGGYLYETDKGEIPQNKLYSKALWEKYNELKKKLDAYEKI